MKYNNPTKSLFNKIIGCHIVNEYNINAKSLFNKITKISYINEIQQSNQELV